MHAWLFAAVLLLPAAVPAYAQRAPTFRPADLHAACNLLQGKAAVLMRILKGGFIFAADLIRALDPCPEGLVVEFVSAR